MASVAGGQLGQSNTLSNGIISCINVGGYGPSTSSVPNCLFANASSISSNSSSGFFGNASHLTLSTTSSSASSNVNDQQQPPTSTTSCVLNNGLQSYLHNVFTPCRNRTISGTPSTPELSPLEFLNDILQAVTGDDSPMCTNCEDGSTATCRCKECSEMLCVLCVKAHKRVRLTRDHRIVPFNTLSPPPLTTISGSPSSIASSLHSLSPCSSPTTCCDYHNDSNRFYCETCFMPACPDCVQKDHNKHQLILYREAMDNAKGINIKLTREAKQAMFFLKDALQTLQNLYKNVNIKSQHAINDVHTIMERFVQAIEERERELLNKVEEIRLNKTKTIYSQICLLHSTFVRLNQTTDAFKDSLESYTNYEMMHANDKISLELKHVRCLRSEFVPNEDDVLVFLPPDGRLLRSVACAGHISTSTQTAAVRPKQQQPSKEGQILPYIAPFRCEKNESRGRPIHGSLNVVAVKRTSDLHHHQHHPSVPSFAFGSEGSGDGSLCRPWGVCCDKKGNVIVADRTNHRVQVFDSFGKFAYKFGCHGTGPGQFDRPAGITIDPANRVIVADKDNHRIQIFTIDGKFLLKFGERGCRPGQFNYPWDVAANSAGQICVSDTRNHRIQLFTGDGTFLRKFGFEGTQHQWHSFDSPRGVCFDPYGHILVTDFNNHRVVIIDFTFTKGRYLGSEGSGQKQFLRPQGIICDDHGRIVVADSRNNRIVVYESDGKFLWEIGKAGKGLGELDRPSGICLSPDGRIVVVDFGNSRVQIF